MPDISRIWNFEGLKVSLSKDIQIDQLKITTKSYSYIKSASTWDEVHNLISAEPTKILLLEMGNSLYHACLETWAETNKRTVPQMLLNEKLRIRREGMPPPRVINHTNLHAEDQIKIQAMQKSPIPRTQRLPDPRLRFN